MKIGIWVDTRDAYIISVDGSDNKIQHITSSIEEYHPIGGSRSNVPYGPMDNVSESKYTQRRKHQERTFFDKIIDNIKQSKDVMIFGPAQMKDRLQSRISDHSELKLKVLASIQSDSMTENQMVAFVKDYYKVPTRL